MSKHDKDGVMLSESELRALEMDLERSLDYLEGLAREEDNDYVSVVIDRGIDKRRKILNKVQNSLEKA